MADWAQRGLGYDVAQRNRGFFGRINYALAAQWGYVKYRSTLFALSVSFYAYEWWKAVNRVVRGVKYEDDEWSEEFIQESKQKQIVFSPSPFLLPLSFLSSFLSPLPPSFHC